jgi:hypothetical protein
VQIGSTRVLSILKPSTNLRLIGNVQERLTIEVKEGEGGGGATEKKLEKSLYKYFY